MTDITVTVHGVAYVIKVTSFKWSVKNKVIKINKRLTKSRQTGSTDPETIGVDIKDVTDMVTISGKLYGQTISSVELNAPAVFNSMKINMVRYPGPHVILHRGISYSGLLDQIEAEDSAQIAQTYKTLGGVKTAGTPNSISITMSLTVLTVK